MALTATELEFYEWAKAALPRFLFAKDRAEEEINAFLKIFDAVRTEIEDTFGQTLIGTAAGIWLTLHAIDRGTDRFDGELDADLRERIQAYKDAVIRSAVLQAAKDAWQVLGFSSYGDIEIVELRTARAYFGDITAYTNTTDGGTFAGPDASNVMTFASDDASFPAPWPIEGALPRYHGKAVVTFANANSAGNDGSFTITGYSGDAIKYVNASGVAEADAGVDVTIKLYETVNDLDATGWAKAYLNRGFRCGGSPPSRFIIILPYEASATEASRLYVDEAVRLKKAAGMPVTVERRASP